MKLDELKHVLRASAAIVERRQIEANTSP